MKLLIISGFLGSGKTTLLLAMARQLAAGQRKVAIVENEIGQIGIDGEYLRREGFEVRELFGGCVCCTLTVDLVTTLRKIAQSIQPDLTIIEATGVARPADIVATVRAYTTDITAVKVFTLIDAETYEMLFEMMSPLMTAQIEAAAVVAVNKMDEVDADTLERIAQSIRQLNPHATIAAISAENRINLETILGELP
jgi:G3E family GTPase